MSNLLRNRIAETIALVLSKPDTYSYASDAADAVMEVLAELIPDVPGLPEIAAIIAEVGPEYIVGALSSAHGQLLDIAMAVDVDTRALIEAQAEMLRRLAAALEVK